MMMMMINVVVVPQVPVIICFLTVVLCKLTATARHLLLLPVKSLNTYIVFKESRQ